MLLAIDVGNTNIVLGTIENGVISNIFRLQTVSGETDTEYAIKIKGVFDFYGISCSDFDGAIISSVVPPVTAALEGAVHKLTGLKAMVIRPGLKTGMNVRIDDPATLAGDLLVGAVAAMVHYGAPVIVIDMGTATTMVAIDKNKTYIGGAILPGVNLGLKALAEGTSLLPDISLSLPKKCIATNTVDSMRSGAVFGTVAMLDGMIDRMKQELGYDCRVVATGGIAEKIIPHCAHEIIYDNDLLLKGLDVIWQKNH